MLRIVFFLSLLTATVAAAAAPDGDAGVQVDSDVLAEFRRIDALSAQGKYEEATGKAQALLPRLEKSTEGHALLLYNLAKLYGLQKHYAHAAMILENCLSLGALPAEDALRARFELGQYHAIAENFDQAAEALTVWVKQSPDPKPEQYLLLADVYQRLKKNKEAAAYLDQAVAHSTQPRAEWLQQLLGLYYQEHDLPNCIRVLTHTVEHYPENPQYWNQLTGIYQEAGKEKEALAAQQLMYKKGLLKQPAQIVQLAQVMRYRGLTARAAELMQREMDGGHIESNPKNLELMANAWLEAKELKKAAATLEKSLTLAYDGNCQHRIGQIYSELHDWPRAQQSLANAISKGGLKNAGGAYLLLGLAHYRLNAKHQAKEAFQKALETQSVRNTAKQWLEHLEKENPSRRG